MNENKLCRLCLHVGGSRFRVINEMLMKMLEVLLLNMDHNVIKNSFICYNCAAAIERSFCFKSACIHTEELVFSFAISSRLNQFDLRDIFQENGDETLIKDFTLCRFCMNQLKNNNVVTMENLMDTELHMEMLPVFMSEMDFGIIKNPVYCTKCKGDLRCYFEFINNCLNAEKRISIRGQNRGDIIGRHLTTLKNIHHDKLIEIEEEVLNIKDEMESEVMLNGSEYRCLHKKTHIKGPTSGTTMYNRKAEQENLTDSIPKQKFTSEMQMYNCNICTFNAEYKSNLKKSNEASDVKRYKCVLCTYKTNRNDSIKRHMLTHKDTSEVEMYKCTTCTYETKRKQALKMHMLAHKDTSEIETYRCFLCTYKAKYKQSLKRHMLNHKHPSQLKMYKCALCSYETKYKAHLITHTVVHKDASEVKMYKCTFCTYETKHKDYLKRHTLIHKDASEVETFRCALCAYVAKHKSNLRKHLLTHRDAPEVKNYKCPQCSYKTSQKCAVKRHMLTHMDASEVEMYKCPRCTFVTKYKFNQKVHLATHKGTPGFDLD